MAEWIEVEIDEREKVRKTTIRGVEVELFVSPYDVPEAVRGHYNDPKNRFILEFRYVGDEPTAEYTFDNGSYTFGQSSGRLYGLEIDVLGLKADSIGISVELHERLGQELVAKIRDSVTGAIDFLLQRHPLGSEKAREDNYKLAKDAIMVSQEKLFAIAA